ncbi:MAG: tetratricopeptide repeat protein [Bacteroidetes bacterium]|nr:tetratricopeptide repeat protein [Bacteroidota bacterium]
MIKKLLAVLVLLAGFTLLAHSQNTTDEQLAAQYFQNGEFEKAADLYEQLYDKSANAFYYNSLLQSLIKAKDFKKSEKVVRKRIKQNQNDLRLAVDLGYVYSASGDEKKAEKQYLDAIESLTANNQQIYDLANAFLVRMQYDNAAAAYLKGRKLMNNTTSFSAELSMIYESRGRYTDMMDEYFNLLNADPNYLSFVETRLQVVLLSDVDNKKSDIIKTSMLKRAQKNPENGLYATLIMWFSIQQKDFELAFNQAKSIDKRFKDNGAKVFELADLCVSNRAYEIAIEAYQYHINKGELSTYYLNSRIGLLNAKYLKTTSSIVVNKKELNELEKEYNTCITELGKSASTILLLKNLAHIYAFYSLKTNEAIDILNEAIALPNADKNIVANCKLELADIQLFGGDVWEATLLYSQVEKAFKNDPIGFEAKFRNAKLSFYIGEFNWAKAQLDVLKAATSKMIANDAMELSLLISDNMEEDSSTVGLSYYAKADLLAYRNQYDLALETLDSTRLLGLSHPIFDDVMYKKAEIKIKQGLYNEADSLLQKLVDFYPDGLLADDALYLEALLNQNQLNNKVKAMICFEKLIFKYPSSLYTVEARKQFRKLRGDQLN